jgi:SAM-dependent methyltransferase
MGGAQLQDLWCCPRCRAEGLARGGGALHCSTCGADFPVVRGRPVLLVPDHPLFPPVAYAQTPARPSAPSRLRGLGASVNLSFDRCIEDLAARLPDRATVLLLGAGAQTGQLRRRLPPPHRVVATDIDAAADVDAWADAHRLPFRGGAFDAVITTAVLEHVMRPEDSMAEISRVLRPAGLVYSEIPFMQQVHEGAYDFTRYTLAGHRRLAAGFDEISSGATAGPGTALVWSIEHFALALGGGRARRTTKALTRIAFGWLAQLDRLLAQRPAALDGASCTYFYGIRRAGPAVPDEAIIAGYRGAQALRHL